MTPVAGLSGLEILLVNTRVGRNTRQLVAGVRARHQAFPKVTDVLRCLSSRERLYILIKTLSDSCISIDTIIDGIKVMMTTEKMFLGVFH